MSRPGIYAKANKSTRTNSSLDQQLRRQVGFLEISCAAFDSGHEEEAIRLATTARVLLHDTNMSHSLLGLLNIKDSLRFTDTGIYEDRYWDEIKEDDPNAFALPHEDVGLICLAQVSETEFGWIAPLNRLRHHENSPAGRSIPWESDFNTWWKKPLITTLDRPFSREQLVLIMANQDGGAHVDEALDDDYQQHISHGLMSRAYINHPEDLTAKPTMECPKMKHTPAYASMRQIAFELLSTLNIYLAQSNK